VSVTPSGALDALWYSSVIGVGLRLGKAPGLGHVSTKAWGTENRRSWFFRLKMGPFAPEGKGILLKAISMLRERGH